MLDLFPYQHVGAQFLADRPRAGLFDVPGIGKTAQSVSACDLIGAQRVLVICPAAVRTVWPTEFRKFQRIPRRVTAAKKIDDLNLWLRGRFDVLVVSYEQATRWAPHLQKDLIEAVIIDEAHYIKDAKAKRTKAILGGRCDGTTGIARMGGAVWFLTGTPHSNSPTDTWTWLRFCGATELSLANYTNTYFNAQPGAFNMSFSVRKERVEELRTIIRSNSLRRTKEQVGLQLPPVWLTTQAIEGDDDGIKALLRQHPGLDAAILDAVERGSLSFVDAQHIGTLRRLTGTGKAPAYAAQLIEELETDGAKRVVIGIHRAVLDIVAAALEREGIGYVRIDGQVTDSDVREMMVTQFQLDPKCRVFLGNIKAAGTGLTLTAAYRIDMLEWSWAPADNAQALMRVHRIGQTHEVHARFISLAKSIDERVSATVARKTAAIAAIEGHEEDEAA